METMTRGDKKKSRKGEKMRGDKEMGEGLGDGGDKLLLSEVTKRVKEKRKEGGGRREMIRWTELVNVVIVFGYAFGRSSLTSFGI